MNYVQGASLENGVYFMTEDNLAIAWSAGDDVIGYVVYLFDDDGTIQRSATSVQNEMIHITRRILPEDSVYEFRVVAHGENGEETSSSVYLSK